MFPLHDSELLKRLKDNWNKSKLLNVKILSKLYLYFEKIFLN